jgi:predicted Co/Zn/Cd cation transporter (cation efflux family)
MTKVGRKFYVEIDFVVDPTWTVLQSDQVRRALTERLDLLPHDLWLTVEFTADRSWGE